MKRFPVFLIIIFFATFLHSQEWWQQSPPSKPASFAYQYKGSANGGSYSALANFEHHFIEFEAEATVDMAKMKNDVQAEIMAQSAAELRAYAQAAKFITGMLVQGVYIVKMGMSESESVGGKIEKTLVKHAQVLSKSVSWERGVPKGKVKIGILFKNNGGIIDIAIPVWRDQASKAGITLYKPNPNTTSSSNHNYSGLIVDTRGLQIKPSLSPLILNSDGKKEIYGILKIDEMYALEKGIVSYHKTMELAKKDDRIGNSPLIIKALNGVKNNRSVVVSDEDALKIFTSDMKNHFLNKCNVVFLID